MMQPKATVDHGAASVRITVGKRWYLQLVSGLLFGAAALVLAVDGIIVGADTYRFDQSLCFSMGLAGATGDS